MCVCAYLYAFIPLFFNSFSLPLLHHALSAITQTALKLKADSRTLRLIGLCDTHTLWSSVLLNYDQVRTCKMILFSLCLSLSHSLCLSHSLSSHSVSVLSLTFSHSLSLSHSTCWSARDSLQWEPCCTSCTTSSRTTKRE